MNKSNVRIAASLIASDPSPVATGGVLFVPTSTTNMGVFTVKVKLSNWQNRFLPHDQRGEDVECDALVDSGASDLCIPAEIVEKLRLEPLETVGVFTADGAQHEYRLVGIVECQVGGRRCRVQAIELPRGAQPLLGAVPMEQMDWHISPIEKRLVPNPRSPDKPLLPLC